MRESDRRLVAMLERGEFAEVCGPFEGPPATCATLPAEFRAPAFAAITAPNTDGELFTLRSAS